MNIELQNILTQITAKQGDTILSEPKRVSAFLSDLAREVPKPQKTALIKSLEHGFAKTLKDILAPERSICKQKLAQKLHDEEGLDLKLCEETLELLTAVLFGEKQIKKDNFCSNCGKELQKEWKTCPYCSIQVENTNSLNKKTTPQKKDTASSNKINIKPLLEEDIVRHQLEIWICGRCNTSNGFELDYCRKCKKEFNPPLHNYSEGRTIKLRPHLWEK
jgi:ribosomal protein L40E